MNTCDVQRFDRSKPPQGYNVGWSTHGTSEWSFTSPAGARFPRPASGIDDLAGFASEAEAIAAAWAQHQERNDPPGMPVEYVRPTDPLWVAAHDGWWVYTTVVGGMLCLFRRDDEASARAAAWAWYWRRVALADALICFDPRKVKWDPDVWPRCLAWSDEQVAAVERWLAEGGELPEVLRG